MQETNLNKIIDYLNDYICNTEKTDLVSFLKKLYPKAIDNQLYEVLAEAYELRRNWDDYECDAEGITFEEMDKFDEEELIPIAKKIIEIIKN